MAEEAAVAVGAGADVNTAGKPTEIAMAYLQDEVTFGFLNVNQFLWKIYNIQSRMRSCMPVSS